MSARVWSTVLCALCCLSCTKRLSDRAIIPARDNNSTVSDVNTKVTWRAELCQPDSTKAPLAGPKSGLTFGGECVLAATELAQCQPQEDDFYILAKRVLQGGRVFVFYVNVERYHGPGEYPALAQAHVMVRDGQTLYRWANFQSTLTLEPGTDNKTIVRLRGARLTAEPGTPTSGFITVDGEFECVPATERIGEP